MLIVIQRKSIKISIIEPRGLVVDSSASDSRGPGFEYRPGGRLSLPNFSCFFSVT